MTAHNIELKARVQDLNAMEIVAKNLCSNASKIIVQTDTYFPVSAGRLKLREMGKDAQLIAYTRPDSCENKLSSYTCVPVLEPLLLKKALSDSLGIRAEVQKRRTLYIDGTNRIHLDQVEKLGDFIEFEAVLRPDEPLESGHERIQKLRRLFNIKDADLIAVSYIDLILDTCLFE